jgi:hypothetical protein
MSGLETLEVSEPITIGAPGVPFLVNALEMFRSKVNGYEVDASDSPGTAQRDAELLSDIESVLVALGEGDTIRVPLRGPVFHDVAWMFQTAIRDANTAEELERIGHGLAAVGAFLGQLPSSCADLGLAG